MKKLKKLLTGITAGTASVIALAMPVAAELPYRGTGSLIWLLRWFAGWF